METMVQLQEAYNVGLAKRKQCLDKIWNIVSGLTVDCKSYIAKTDSSFKILNSRLIETFLK